MKASFLAAVIIFSALSASFANEAKALTACQINIENAVLAQAKTDFPGLDLFIKDAPDTSQQEGQAEYRQYNVSVYQTTHDSEGHASTDLLAVYRVGVDEVCGVDVQPLEH
jgi:hypothetical protein